MPLPSSALVIRLLESPSPAPSPAGPLDELVRRLHECNAAIWAEEDAARRERATDAELVANKRAIDRFNQQRNDTVEACDEAMLRMLADRMASGAALHSETPGQMIDRLSILTLRIAAMRAQALRRDVDDAHRATCAAKVQRLAEQREDLCGCFDRLLDACVAGTARFKLYRQYKMYNDPALNPRIYGERSTKA